MNIFHAYCIICLATSTSSLYATVNLYSDAFQSKLHNQYTSPLNTSVCIPLIIFYRSFYFWGNIYWLCNTQTWIICIRFVHKQWLMHIPITQSFIRMQMPPSLRMFPHASFLGIPFPTYPEASTVWFLSIISVFPVFILYLNRTAMVWTCSPQICTL